MPDVPIYPKKAWTLLVFMAGDNDMESFADLDLVEMEALPSDEHLHVVAQFDSRAEATYRYRFLPGSTEVVGKPLGEVNTGDPNSLTQFVMWGKKHFPAERTALVIWNHGTGLRDLPDDFNYSALRSTKDSQTIKAEIKRTLFAPTLAKMAKTCPRLRGVAIDATDRDYLDNQELKDALTAIPADGPRVDLIGFDACLMNTVEIAYQLRGLAQLMVGSQETEPGIGWPYKEIVTTLAAKPTMTPGQLAETIVSLYTEATGKKMRGRSKASPYTQSALDLCQVELTFKLVNELTLKLLDEEVFRNSVVRKALSRTRKEVKRFHDRELVDLMDWCEFMYLWTKGNAGKLFRESLLALRDHLKLGEALIVANQAHGGKDAAHIHGVSIFWPQEKSSIVYNTLDFACSRWGELVKQMMKYN